MESHHPQTAVPFGSAANDAPHPTDASSFFEDDEAPTWKEKARRFVKPWKRTERVTKSNTTANMYMDTARPSGVTAPGAVHGNNHTGNETAPSASSSSSRQPRRRRYVDGWVRFPKNSSSSTNSSSTSPATPSKVKDAYRNALKDRLVRKHLAICAVSGLLLLILISLCTFSPPLLYCDTS